MLSAEVQYRLDRSQSFAKFTIESQLAVLSGRLDELDGTLSVKSRTPLRFQIDATANLRSIKFDTSGQFAGLSSSPLMQSIPNPSVRLSGLLSPAGRGQCIFEGIVVRGQHRERMKLACKCMVTGAESVIVENRSTRNLGEISGELPIQLPLGEGTGVTTTRLTFKAQKGSKN